MDMKALIVEDNVQQAETTRHHLSHCGFDADIAADGETGLDLLLRRSYDLAIVDVRLPRMDGFEIVRRARGLQNETPIIILSVQGSPASKAAGLNLGADDYMSKPFSVEELRARIHAVLRRTDRAAAANPIQCDTLNLDPVGMRVTRSGRLLHLSRLEFDLLEYMMRHRGHVLTKRMILERIWDYPGVANDHVVELVICSLRKKINPPGERPLIRTERGLGYGIE